MSLTCVIEVPCTTADDIDRLCVGELTVHCIVSLRDCTMANLKGC